MRRIRLHRTINVLLTASLLGPLAVSPAPWAQDAQEQSEEQKKADKEARKAEIEKGRQERIDAYLKERERKKAEKAARKAERDAAKAADTAPDVAAPAAEPAKAVNSASPPAANGAVAPTPSKPSATPVNEQAADTEKAQRKRQREEERAERKERREAEKAAREDQVRKVQEMTAQSGATSSGKRVRAESTPRRRNKGLAATQARLRQSDLGREPRVVEYLDLFATGVASSSQYATFANFLAQSGYLEDSLVYYDEALERDPVNSTLWLNHGTILRQLEDYGGAMRSFEKAIDLDPNNALAHFNLGVAHQRQNRYEEAVSSFTSALRLDPTLGEPAYNPLAIDNDLLVPVKLKLYKTQSGALGLPLVEVEEKK